MKLSLIDVDPASRYQIMTFVVEGSSGSKRVRLELRYLAAPEKWYISRYEAQTGNPICLYVPVVASYNELNDLLEPYAYKNIGSMVCVPLVDQPSSPDPTLNNWEEFALCWSENFYAE